MKAIIYRDTGAPDVLRFVDRDLPAPGLGEVRVRVAVSGVNPTDCRRVPAPDTSSASPRSPRTSTAPERRADVQRQMKTLIGSAPEYGAPA